MDDPATSIRRVVIVGGGWCGAAVAYHLLRRGDARLDIHVLEPGDSFGRGVAYGVEHARLLLNVPAGRMSMDPDRPDDFVAWVRATHQDVSGHDFVPRSWVGAYVSRCIAEARHQARSRLEVVRDEATTIRRVAGRWRVACASGAHLDADAVVMATGHGPVRVPEALTHLRDDPRVVADPWARGALRGFDGTSRVLVVGTGLTALDVLRVLRDSGHHGPLHAVSRSGAWPRPHRPDGEASLPRWYLDPGAAPDSADGLAAWFGAELAAARAADVPWQAVLVAVRPHISTLWGRLRTPEKARFLGTYRSRWEVLRHRAPHAAWRELRAWHDEGWVRTFAGGVQAADATGSGVCVRIGEVTRPYDHIVLCTGAVTDPHQFRGPLWRQVLAEGVVVGDALGLGILTGDAHAVVGAHGPHADLWAIGGLQRPRLYESTSVPDLSTHARDVACGVLAHLEAGAR